MRKEQRPRGLFDFCYRFYWIEHRAAEQAAGIAFRLLINLFPMFSLVSILVSIFLRNSDYAGQVVQLLYQLFPAGWEDQIATLSIVSENAGTYGIIGFLILCWFSTTLLESIGHAFFHQYGIPIRQTLRLRGIGLLLIFALAFVLMVTVFLTSIAAWVNSEVRAQLQPNGRLWGWLLQLGTSLTGWLFIFILLFTLYWLIPNIGLRPRNAWAGAFLSATLFTLALQLFPLYLRFRPLSISGGTFGFIFLLTTWLYLLAHILLLGNALNAYRYLAQPDCPTPNTLV